MTTYVVTRLSDGVTVYRYTSDSPIAWDGMGFDTHAHTPVAEPPPEAPPQATRHVTKLAFRLRFSPEERVAIEVASVDDPGATQQHRAMAAAIRSYTNDLMAAEFVDLDTQDTVAGVGALVTAGLLPQARADEILGAPVTDAERYKGAA